MRPRVERYWVSSYRMLRITETAIQIAYFEIETILSVIEIYAKCCQFFRTSISETIATR